MRVYSLVGERGRPPRSARPDSTMFAIVISEKGGAERRELFDKHEINVGRVQGNDLMLPKGNVSKRHARLLFRDGRFIVTDLKSTNGTYVNGRKIAQATIVREGDKIYVGDFVLRVETTGHGSGPPQPRPSGAGSITASSGAALAAVLPRPTLLSDSEFTAKHEALSATSLQDQSDVHSPRQTPREPVDSSVQSPTRLSTPSLVDSREGSTASHGHRVPSVPLPTLVPRPPFSSGRHVDASPRAMAIATLIERVGEAIDLAPLTKGAEPDQVLGHRIER